VIIDKSVYEIRGSAKAFAEWQLVNLTKLPVVYSIEFRRLWPRV